MLTLDALKQPLMANATPPPTADTWLEEPKKMPSLLNVLTILTIIWNSLNILLAIYGYFAAPGNYDRLVQAQDKMDQAPAFLKNMMGPDPVGMARRSLDNRVPILLLGLVGCLLCLYGAIQMRKLKKTGFSIYIIGDIVPFLSLYLFIGMGAIGGFTAIIGVGLTLLFLILYATQLKYMK